MFDHFQVPEHCKAVQPQLRENQLETVFKKKRRGGKRRKECDMQKERKKTYVGRKLGQLQTESR